jgi:hypothetical protein
MLSSAVFFTLSFWINLKDRGAEKSLPPPLAISSGYEEVRLESSDSLQSLMEINRH